MLNQNLSSTVLSCKICIKLYTLIDTSHLNVGIFSSRSTHCSEKLTKMWSRKRIPSTRSTPKVYGVCSGPSSIWLHLSLFSSFLCNPNQIALQCVQPTTPSNLRPSVWIKCNPSTQTFKWHSEGTPPSGNSAVPVVTMGTVRAAPTVICDFDNTNWQMPWVWLGYIYDY